VVVTNILKKLFASMFMVCFSSEGSKSQICPITLNLVPQTWNIQIFNIRSCFFKIDVSHYRNSVFETLDYDKDSVPAIDCRWYQCFIVQSMWVK